MVDNTALLDARVLDVSCLREPIMLYAHQPPRHVFPERTSSQHTSAFFNPHMHRTHASGTCAHARSSSSVSHILVHARPHHPPFRPAPFVSVALLQWCCCVVCAHLFLNPLHPIHSLSPVNIVCHRHSLVSPSCSSACVDLGPVSYLHWRTGPIRRKRTARMKCMAYNCLVQEIQVGRPSIVRHDRRR